MRDVCRALHVVVVVAAAADGGGGGAGDDDDDDDDETSNGNWQVQCTDAGRVHTGHSHQVLRLGRQRCFAEREEERLRLRARESQQLRDVLYKQLQV